MTKSNYDRIFEAVKGNQQLVNIGDYNPEDYESIEDALNSDNAVIKAIAMLIIYGNKPETQVYNEISNYLINNLV